MLATIEVGGHALALLPEKAAYLPEFDTLLVADAHIGKGVSFRRLGVPVPRGTTMDTLGTLSRVVDKTGARRVVFLGDFLHSARARAPATLAALGQWRARHAALDLVLVRGNHDERAGDPPASLGFEVVDEPWILHGLALCHHPMPHAGHYVLGGHLHPCVSVGDRAFGRMRLPCFHFGAAVGVLPAFGRFTGMHPVRPASGDRVFAVADEAVRELRSDNPNP